MGIIIDDLDESEYGVAGYGEMSARLDAAEQQVKSLTAQLASAKEEGAALIESQMQRAEAAEAALSAERKETERLRGLMRDALNPTTLGVSHLDIEDCKCWNCCQKRLQAALQERQGEE